MRNHKTTNSVITALGAVLLLAVAAPAWAADAAETIESLAIGSASTPAQHAALASYYREKAGEARAEVQKHTSMKHGYALNTRSPGAGASMGAHCDRLIKNAETDAVEYDAMAAEHDQMAKQGK